MTGDHTKNAAIDSPLPLPQLAKTRIVCWERLEESLNNGEYLLDALSASFPVVI